MRRTIVGTFDFRRAVGDAIDRLVRLGFSVEDISVMMATDVQDQEFKIERALEMNVEPEAESYESDNLEVVIDQLGSFDFPDAPEGLEFVATGPHIHALAGVAIQNSGSGPEGGMPDESHTGLPDPNNPSGNSALGHGAILLGVEAEEDLILPVKKTFQDLGALSISEHNHA